MAAIFVASLLWLPSDCTGRAAAVDAAPAEPKVAAAAAASATTRTRTTSAAGQFSVHMILPFSKSTIRYSYTEPSGLATSERTPSQATDVGQAHSVSVSPYGCGTVAGGGGQRKRKRVRWKTNAVPGTGATAAADGEQSNSVTRAQSQTNTLVPLPGYPTADGGRGTVFEAAAEHLDQLYTVRRVDGAVSGSGDDAVASGEGGTTKAPEDGTAV